jgi:DNA-binding FadR family transcriptional regulator
MQFTRSVLLTPITPTKATDQIVERLCEAISSGVLKPGDRLPVEAELAIQLDVAQMTLRQALEIMRERGLIETIRGRNGGSFVTKNAIRFFNSTIKPSLKMQELQDLTDFRMAIENESAALAAMRATKIDLGKLRLKLEDCTNHLHKNNDHWIADNIYHVAVAEITGSARLLKSVSQVQYELSAFFQPLIPTYDPHESHYEEHIAIMQAIESGDPDSAWEASNRHLVATHNYIANLLLIEN